MKKTMKKLKLKISVLMITIFATQTAFANEITNSKIFKGGERFIQDCSAALMVIAPLAGGLYIGVCFLKKKFADEHEKKQWDKNIKIAIYCIIGVFGATTIVNIVTHYFK